jgi:hypothetical protein
LHNVSSILVYNQRSDFELVSPTYFGSNIIWHIDPNQKVDVNTMTKAIFEGNISERGFTSVLMYQLQRKGALTSNEDNISTENTSTAFQLLVIWRSDSQYECSIHVLLISHDNTTTLDKDKVKELDYQPSTLLRNGRISTNTWTLDDATVLITSKWEKQIRTIKITISEETGENNYMKPLWISSNM